MIIVELPLTGKAAVWAFHLHVISVVHYPHVKDEGTEIEDLVLPRL